MFTGLFAKEAIVGTVNSLYASLEETPAGLDETAAVEEAEETGLDISGSVIEAFASIGEGLVGIISSVDILGISLITEDSDAIGEEIGADTSVYKHIAAHFTVFSAFAYLLFVLMYFPCLAVIGAARQEMGGYYAGVMAIYSTLLAWSVATIFYQVAEGHNIGYIILSAIILLLLYGGLYLIGKKEHEPTQKAFAIPVRKDCCG